MSAPKHTAGPWVYYPASNYAGFAVAPLGTLPTLAAVERPRGNPQTLNVTAFNFPGETEANARLIAAAPDLLEALRRLSALTPGAANAATARDLHLTVKAIADTAIAKATGEGGS